MIYEHLGYDRYERSSEPKVVSAIDDKIISMYAKGITTRQISDTIEDIYSFEVSEGMVSDITDKLLPEIENWLSVLNSLKNRGVQDILVLCADILTGIKEAIGAAYPNTKYQRCIVLQVRNTLKYVADKDKKEFASDLKTIYTAPDEKTGLKQLEATKKWTMPLRNWGKVYGELSIMYPGRLPE